MPRPPHYRCQHSSVPTFGRRCGFTIVELMIAIAMGLFLMAGIFGVVVSMKRTFTTSDQLTKLQENQRFLLNVFDNTIRVAGYYVDPVLTSRADLYLVAPVANPDGSQFVADHFIIGTSGAGGVGDTVNVRYQSGGNNSVTNCLGETGGTPAVFWINSFAVINNQLTCAVSVNGAAFGTPTVLADNVQSFTVTYGIDTNDDGSVDTYVASTGVADWLRVRTVRLKVIFVDPTNSKPGVTALVPAPLLYTVTLMNRPL